MNSMILIAIIFTVQLVLWVNSTGSMTNPKNNPYANLTISFAPFHKVLTSLMKWDSAYITANKDKLLNCWSPSSTIALRNSTVIISYTNSDLFPLIVLRHRVLSESENGMCIQSLVITICLDARCLELCATNNIPNCLLLEMPKIPYVEFAGGFEYFYLTWLKYELAFSALDYANEVFYLDADVLLRRNPFGEVKFGRDAKGKKEPGEFDVMYQRERGMKELGCGGSVNGGLLYFRNSTQLRQLFIPKMLSHKEEIINGKGRSDQEIMGDYVGKVRFCTLPVKLFTGHCMGSQFLGRSIPQPSEVITYHTNCVTGLKAKIANMKQFLNQAGKVRDVEKVAE